MSGSTAASLKLARKRARLSVAQAADKLEVSASTLKRWEAGTHIPSNATLRDICKQWGVNFTGNASEAGPSRCWSYEMQENRPVLQVLRLKRRRLGISLQELSDATAISVPALSRYELGQRVPPSESLTKISSAMDISNSEVDKLSLILSEPMGTTAPACPHSAFRNPELLPHLNLYHRLEWILKANYDEPRARANDIYNLLLGFSCAGDPMLVLEAWEQLKAQLDAPKSINIATVLTLTGMNRADSPKEHLADFKRIRKHIPTIIDSNDTASLSFLVLRMALMLKDNEDADDLLGRIEALSPYIPELKFSTCVYRDVVDAEFGDKSAVSRIRDKAQTLKDPVTAYTALVLASQAEAKHNKDREASNTLLVEGRVFEDKFGVGSPLANRLRHTLKAG